MFAGSLSPPTATSVQLICERGFLLSVSPALMELSRHQILVGSLLSHLSVSQMEPHGLRLHVPHLQVWLWLLPAFSFSIATSLYCQCFASAHVSQRQPEKELFCFDSVLSQDLVLASLWPGTNINAFLCLSMEEKQIN